MLDRLMAFAVQHRMPAALILTKADLAGARRRSARRVYAPWASGAGRPAQDRGRHRRAAGPTSPGGTRAGGKSGVGKSSIFRALGGIATVGELSRFGRGRQTTSSARLFQTAEGFLIDSPGIGEFILDPMPPAELPQLFVKCANRRPAAASPTAGT